MEYLNYASLSMIVGLCVFSSACGGEKDASDDAGGSSTTSEAPTSTGASSTTSGATGSTTHTSTTTGVDTETGTESGDSTDSSTGAETDSSTGAETDSSTGTDPDTRPLAECYALPAAEEAEWVEGPSVEPSGESTPERIENAGLRTWELALDLLRATPVEDSLAMSPTALSMASTVTYRSYASGECGDQIHSAMHYSEEGEPLYDTMSASMRTLLERAQPASEDADPIALELRPSVWELGEAPDEPVADSTFGSTIHYAPGDRAAVREVMNCVIEQQSGGLLTDFIPSGFPEADTSRFDVAVSFLQAPWDAAMESRGDMDFEVQAGDVRELPSIGAAMEARVYEAETWLSVEIPLRGGDLSVLLLTPQRDSSTTLEALTEALTPAEVELAIGSSSPIAIDLKMPIVDIQSQVIDYYPLLGLDCPLFTLRTILHGAALHIDDKGIKAAAATANENWESSGEVETELTIELDRPFLVFVYDRPTNFVLYNARFAG